MIDTIQNIHPFFLRRLDITCDLENLLIYLNRLSPQTKNRFAPHAFEHQSIIDFYTDITSTKLGYIALDMNSNEIIAYAVIKTGYLEHDRERLESYGIRLNQNDDCAFAPSVADNLQGKGFGKKLLQFILADLRSRNTKRIILWGGVQADNTQAINYYLNNGFTSLGQFEHNGLNYDMALTI